MLRMRMFLQPLVASVGMMESVTTRDLSFEAATRSIAKGDASVVTHSSSALGKSAANRDGTLAARAQPDFAGAERGGRDARGERRDGRDRLFRCVYGSDLSAYAPRARVQAAWFVRRTHHAL